jgi:hypothetical protein
MVFRIAKDVARLIEFPHQRRGMVGGYCRTPAEVSIRAGRRNQPNLINCPASRSSTAPAVPDQSCDGFDSRGERNCYDNPARIPVRSFRPIPQRPSAMCRVQSFLRTCLRLSDCPDQSGNRFGRQDQPSLITRFAKQHGARKVITPLLPSFRRPEARRRGRLCCESREP